MDQEITRVNASEEMTNIIDAALSDPMLKEKTLLVTARLKTKDLEARLQLAEREKDLLKTSYDSTLKTLQRAESLLEDYAALSLRDKGRRKLDRKLGVFFPAIMQSVQKRRQKH